jgi:hypothetical protein
MPKLPVKPEWLRTTVTAPLVGVDRDKKVIRGFAVAEAGPFKSEGRGEFDSDAIHTIARMMNAAPSGLKSRLAHPGLSEDGIGSFLGRAKNARVEMARRPDREGKTKLVDMVRADLHLDPSSFASPKGNLGQYVMDLAESDPGSFGSSLVLQADQEYRRDEKGVLARDDEGNELPPLWRPTRLHASDVVDEGDAVHGGFLSTAAQLDLDALPDAVVRQAWALLNTQFPDDPREVVEARCKAWLGRYLDFRFPPPESISTPRLDEARGRLEAAARAIQKLGRK